MAKSKEPVRLRQRLMASGNTSLYLDIYVNGKRNYEYLNLYLIPEVSRSDKAKNKETMRLAEAIRAKRVIEVQNGLYGFSEGYKLDTNFLDYYYRLCEQRHGEMSRGNWGNWLSAYRHLQIYCKPNLTGETGAYWDSMIAEKRCHSDILHQNGMADYQRFAVLKIAVMPQKPEHSGTNAVSRGMPHQKPEHTGTVDRR